MSDEIAWLLDADPAIRWQVLRDLSDAPVADVAAERARVVETGWGKRLLDLQANGQWAGGACFPEPGWRPPEPMVGDPDGQPWTATLPTLRLLRDFGIDPAHPAVRAAVGGVRQNSTWEYAGEPFFDGEVEPCINGGTVAIGAYFGENVGGIVNRLLTEQLDDGGWNCEAERGSTRSSFHSTICVLEGLLEYERAGGTMPVADARRRGEEYLLARSLYRRASTGKSSTLTGCSSRFRCSGTMTFCAGSITSGPSAALVTGDCPRPSGCSATNSSAMAAGCWKHPPRAGPLRDGGGR